MKGKEDESKPSITITPYSDEYKDQVRDVIGKTLASVGVVESVSLPIDDPDLEKIESEYLGFWIALAEGKVVGTVAIRDLGEQVAKLRRLFVLDEHHGSGIGQQLLDTASDFAEEQGFKKLVLDTDEKMHRAHKFYERNGFVQQGKDGDRFHYEKNLMHMAKAINTLKR